MRPHRGPVAPQNQGLRALSSAAPFVEFSPPLGRFVRFNGDTNAVECSPPASRPLWRLGGGGKATGSQAADCGLSVDWRMKVRGKALENLCAKLTAAWTTSPPSTAGEPPQRRQETPVHNPAILHSQPTPSALSSSGRQSLQSVYLQRLASGGAVVIHGQEPSLLL